MLVRSYYPDPNLLVKVGLIKGASVHTCELHKNVPETQVL